MTQHLPDLRLDRFAGIYLWLGFVVVFGVWKPDLFLTTATLHSVASANAATALLAIAVLIPLCAGAYDLSAGATMNFATVVAIWLQTERQLPMGQAIAIAVLVGGLIGAVNGVVVVKLKVNSFIATLGMSSIVLAVQAMIVGATQPVPPSAEAWFRITTSTFLGFQVIVIYVLVLACGAWWLLTRTAPGRYIHAAGGNADAARLAGVAVDRYVFTSFLLSGLVAGVGGVLYGSLYGPSLTYGSSLLLPAFAAAFLGSVLGGGRFNVWGAVGAVYILATGIQGLQFVTSAQWLAGLFNGVVLVVAVAFAMWRQRVAADQRARGKAGALRREMEDEHEPNDGASAPSAATGGAGHAQR